LRRPRWSPAYPHAQRLADRACTAACTAQRLITGARGEVWLLGPRQRRNSVGAGHRCHRTAARTVVIVCFPRSRETPRAPSSQLPTASDRRHGTTAHALDPREGQAGPTVLPRR